MNSQNRKPMLKLSVVAVRRALLACVIAPAAFADADSAEAPRAASAAPTAVDPAIAELVDPIRQIEIGIGDVDGRSAKFGEYNGHNRAGPFAIGNVRMSGGGAWDSDDATRWNIRASDLGLNTRDVEADYGVQGKFRLNFGYDELQHNGTDRYQTPYLGTGTGSLTLPDDWKRPVVPQVNATDLNFRVLSPTVGPAGSLAKPVPSAAQLAIGQGIRDADLPAFHNVDIDTKRRAYDGGFTYDLSREWQVTGSVRHETKEGTKLTGAISSISTIESTVILPDLVDTVTDQFNLGIGYTGKKGFAQLGYYGSLYHNHSDALTWQDPSDLKKFSTQSSSQGPDNQFHQANFSGGYNFTPTTRLVVNANYGHNTQNDQFLSDSGLPLGLPRSSLDGEVVTSGVKLKLTARPIAKLNTAVSYKYDDRDNRTPIDTYVFYDVNAPKGATASAFNTALGLPKGTLSSNVNIFNNRPQSRSSHQASFDADYPVARGQTLAVGYDFQSIHRECNTAWIDCEDGKATDEHTARTEWRSRLSDTLSSKIGYSYSKRTVDYNIDAWLAAVPMANVKPGSPIVGATGSVLDFMRRTGISGWGPIAGFPKPALKGDAAIFTPNNNIISQVLYGSRDQMAENPLMRRFNVADRDRNKVRSSLNWEPTDKLSLYGGLDFNEDNYGESQLGLRNGKGWTSNFDGAYAFTNALNVDLFYTHEDMRSKQQGYNYVGNSAAAAGKILNGGCFKTVAEKNLNSKINPCNAWNSQSDDRADTIGLTFQDKGLMGGKLGLSADLVYTLAVTDIGVRGGTYATIPGKTDQLFIAAKELPDVTSRILGVRVNAQYEVTKQSSVRMFYNYERLTGADFAYAGTQAGTMKTFMPSFESFPRYSEHLFGIAFVQRF